MELFEEVNADKHQSSFLKTALSKIEVIPRYEERRWGTIKTLDRDVNEGSGVITNIVKVEPGQCTTYHRHLKHEEIITVISGEGRLLFEEKEFQLSAGVTFTMPRDKFHKISAVTKLRYLEVLLGEVDGDDIERVSGSF